MNIYAVLSPPKWKFAGCGAADDISRFVFDAKRGGKLRGHNTATRRMHAALLIEFSEVWRRYSPESFEEGILLRNRFLRLTGNFSRRFCELMQMGAQIAFEHALCSRWCSTGNDNESTFCWFQHSSPLSRLFLVVTFLFSWCVGVCSQSIPISRMSHRQFAESGRSIYPTYCSLCLYTYGSLGKIGRGRLW